METEQNTTRKKGGVSATGAFQRARHYLFEEAWEVDLTEMPLAKKVVITSCRMVAIVINGFAANKCRLRAAALTYATVFSFIPLLALAFAMAGLFKGQIGGEIDSLEDILIAKLAPGSAGKFQDAVGKIKEFIDNFHSLSFGTVGAIVLFFSVYSLFSQIEGALNEIWGVKRHRAFFLKIWMYWGIVTLGTIILASSLSVSAAPARLPFLREVLEFGPIATLFGFLLPYLITSAFLAAIYKFMTNTRVPTRSALCGGFVAGILWETSKQIYVFYVIKILQGGDRLIQVYSGLAAIPLFLIWVYLSWTIFLLGAEVAYAVQSIETYRMDRRARRVSFRYRDLLSLRVLLIVSKYFVSGKPGPTAEALAAETQTSLHLINEITYQLTRAGFLAEAAHPAGSFIPAVLLDQLTPHVVMNRLRNMGSFPEMDSSQTDYECARGLLDRADAANAEAFRDRNFRVLAEELIDRSLKERSTDTGKRPSQDEKGQIGSFSTEA